MESTSSLDLSGGAKTATSFSCVRCFDRKVKCNRQQPCSACIRHHADCIYRVPAPPKRRKRRVHEELLTERLKRYEQILQQQGIDPDEIAPRPNPGSTLVRADSQEVTSPGADQERQYVSSQLLYDQGRSRYVENNLWNRVAEEFGSPQDAIDDSSEDEHKPETPLDDGVDFILVMTPSSATSRPSHPPPEQIFHLWQIFLENINPLSKIVHRPTLEAMIHKAVANLDRVPRGLEALMFAIYSGAMLSLKNEDCEHQFGESRRVLLSRYQTATKLALVRAKFLGTSDLIVLQALTLHLLTTRDEYDARTLWVLMGVAIRIAEGMGLHRDGTDLGLPIFESEMRRRIWWQISMLDYRSAELSGSAKFRSVFGEEGATKMPLNVDDADLYPGMTSIPLPPARATEMVFTSLRYHFAYFWNVKQKEKSVIGGKPSHLWSNYGSPEAIAEKDQQIDELQQLLQASFVRFCDPIEPIQLMTSLVASGAIHSMRLVAHHPRRYLKEDDIPESERKILWNASLRALEGYNMAYTERKLQRFIWHVNFHFQWQAIIYVLDCLRAKPYMAEASKGWRVIDEIFENRIDLVDNTSRPLHVATGTLCLKAYAAREQIWAQSQSNKPLEPPNYIAKLRRQRERAHAKHAVAVAARLQAQRLDDTSAGSTVASGVKQLPYGRQPVSHSSFSNDTVMVSTNSTSINTPSEDYAMNSNKMDPRYADDSVAGGIQNSSSPWYDGFGFQNTETDTNMMGIGGSNGPNLDPNFMLTQDGNAMDMNANMIDWTQWDTLFMDPTLVPQS